MYKNINNIPICRRCPGIDWTLQSVMGIADELYQQINCVPFGTRFLFMRTKMREECFHFWSVVLFKNVNEELPPGRGAGFPTVNIQTVVGAVDTIVNFEIKIGERW